MAGKFEYDYHQSDLGQFDFCLERGASEFYNEVPKKVNESALYGSAIHSGIEYRLRERIEGHKPPPLTDMVEAFGIELNAQIEAQPTVKWVRHKGPEDLVKKAARAYGEWIVQIEPHVDAQHVEWKFDKVLLHEDDERVIRLSGQLDCIDTRGVIWDWKTASREYQGWEKQRWAVQPSVYSYGWRAANSLNLNIEQEFQYAIMLANGDIQRLKVTRTAEHYEWLKHKLIALSKALEGESRPLPLNDTGWWCSPDWCSNWDRCKGAHHGGDDWKKVQKV